MTMDGPPRHPSAADAALPPVPPVEAEPHGRMWADEPLQFQCLTPLGGRDSADVKRALAALTKVGVFPAPHPTVLTEDDLWKLGSYPYRVLPRPAGLRMLLCMLKVQGRTLSILLRENMMIVRVAMGKIPFAMFKGTVMLGYATQEQDGSAAFSVTDALFSKGANVGRLPWQARRQALQEFAHAYAPEDSGFSLYVPPMAPVRDRVFWRSLDGDWRSLLFVPEERPLKLGAAQSTLFELSRLDVDAVAEAMTNEVVDTGDDTSFRPRFGLAPPPPMPTSTSKAHDDVPPAAAAPSTTAAGGAQGGRGGGRPTSPSTTTGRRGAAAAHAASVGSPEARRVDGVLHATDHLVVLEAPSCVCCSIRQALPLTSIKVRFRSWARARRLPATLLTAPLPKPWSDVRMCLAEQHYMGHSLRRPDAASYPDAIEGYRENGARLEDGDQIEENSTIVCKRMPGHTPMPYKGCVTEDDRIVAHCLRAEREWQESGKALRAEARAAREDLPKVPRGIPSSMLRTAVTSQEQERAMQGPSGTLVVWAAEPPLSDSLCDSFLLK